jgi:hypothetical protein
MKGFIVCQDSINLIMDLLEASIKDTQVNYDIALKNYNVTHDEYYKADYENYKKRIRY